MEPSPELSVTTTTGFADSALAFHPDELHVLVTGLDPLAATTALLLADMGVCLLNVSDPSPVTTQDLATGPYPATLVGSPREYALRKLLRNRWPRCVPLSAPELFCSSEIPAAVMLRSAAVTGPLPGDLTTAGLRATPDAHLPVVTVISDGSASLRWPVCPWYRRPCRECMVTAVGQARKTLRDHPPWDPHAVSTPQSPALTALTRVLTAADSASQLIGRATHWTGAADPSEPSAARTVTLRYGLYRTAVELPTDCLCALDG